MRPPRFAKIRQIRTQLKLSGLKLPLALSLLNQCISSGGNFLLSVYLARTLALSDFGLYGIGYGLCMLYVGIGNAVIMTQMLVNMPSKAIEDRHIYAAKMLNAVLLLGLTFIVLSTGVIGITSIAVSDKLVYFQTCCAIVTAAIFFLCSEFFIAYAYLIRRESLALVVNGLTMFVLFLCLAYEYQAGIIPTAESVMYFYALGAAIGAITAYGMSNLKLRQGFRNLKPDMNEAWQHGRWALGGVLVTWMQSQTYAYIAIIFLGPIGVGQANAAKIFISPFSFLLPAINKIALPRLADLHQTDPARMLRISMLMTTCLSLLAIIFSFVLIGNLDSISDLVLGRQDATIRSLIWIWCLMLVCQMARSGGSVLLQIQRKFRILTLLNIPSAIVTLVLAFLLIKTYGTAGAIWSMVAGELVLSLLIWWEILNEKNRPH